MKERKLNIYYDGPLESELDKELKEVCEKYGWIWYGSGMELESWVRDIAFYKEEKDD